MFCETCLKPFVECTCFKGKARVQQYIDLIRKELAVMEDVVFHSGTYYIRVAGRVKKAKIIKMTDQPLCVILAAVMTFNIKDGFDYEHKGFKIKVVNDMELLDKNGLLILKQLIKPVHVALKERNYSGDTLTPEWRLGSE